MPNTTLAAVVLAAAATLTPQHVKELEKLALEAIAQEAACARAIIAIPTDVPAAEVRLLENARPGEKGSPNALHVRPAGRRDGTAL